MPSPDERHAFLGHVRADNPFQQPMGRALLDRGKRVGEALGSRGRNNSWHNVRFQRMRMSPSLVASPFSSVTPGMDLQSWKGHK